MALNDVFELSLLFNLKGQKLANVLHFEQDSADGAIPPNEDICNAFYEDCWPAMQDLLSNDISLENIKGRRIDPTPGGVYLLPVGEPGNVGVDSLPPNSTLLTTIYTNELSRSGRGRMSISGIPKSYSQNGLMQNGAIATVAAFYDLLLATIQYGANAVFTYGVWSALAETWYEAVSYQIRPQLHTLRGRRMENP